MRFYYSQFILAINAFSNQRIGTIPVFNRIILNGEERQMTTATVVVCKTLVD